MAHRLIDKGEKDGFHDECGVFGVFRNENASALTALGLHALQHRGQEAAGIVSCHNGAFRVEKHMGLVGENFTRPEVIDHLKGDTAVGHNRYSTSGEPALHNVQPLYAETAMGSIAVAHNGNLTNAEALKAGLVRTGSIFQSTSDTEVLIHLFATSAKTSFRERFIDAVRRVEGGFAIIALTDGMMVACRDPLGIRPLVMGEYEGATVFASESCALDIIGAHLVRDIEPGEMVILTDDGLQSLRPFGDAPRRSCIFEYVYFARPDSVIAGVNVYHARKSIGVVLAEESPAPADIVVPVPDSGVPAAIGFADAAGLPFELGIIRNQYKGRTFIEPEQSIRSLGVKLKHNANRTVLQGKSVVLVDDSIVRGTTSKKVVEMVRNAGAREVHMRIASPPTTDSCFYGVDTPDRSELIASRMTIAELEDYIQVDSLAFLSLDGLYKAVGETGRNAKTPQYCDACFTGDYPVAIKDATVIGRARSKPLLSVVR